MTKMQVEIDAEECQRECIGVINRSDVPTIAAAAYVQATLAQAMGQAMIQLLKHKNICSEAEIQKILGDSYHAEAVKRRNSGGGQIIKASAGMLKPNGSF